MSFAEETGSGYSMAKIGPYAPRNRGRKCYKIGINGHMTTKKAPLPFLPDPTGKSGAGATFCVGSGRDLWKFFGVFEIYQENFRMPVFGGKEMRMQGPASPTVRSAKRHDAAQA